MRRYNPKEIEPKWQKIWAQSKIYEATEDKPGSESAKGGSTTGKSKPKRYVLEYFPYPSGSAMHVGHVRNYTIGDVVSRFMRMQGNNVLHPMGWDAFGLPAENYAIKTGISPQEAVAKNVQNFKQQLTQMGFSYDWSREVNSTDPSYYKWTQWFFLLLYKKGLAYQKESLQWWCPFDKTVLANEQVENGRCWRCGNLVEKKALKQWFFKITDYADRLDADLDKVNWSEAIKSMQRNWIGKSKGAEIKFQIPDSRFQIPVFTTRPDTIFGATFLVLAPEHKAVEKILDLSSISEEHKQTVRNYVQTAERKSDIERQETEREKTGVFTGAYAVNPANREKVAIWIADYVLPGYGTGAIMAVPAHDERDHEFAQKFDLPIKPVILPDYGNPHPDAEYVEGVVVIPYNTETGQFLALDKWANGVGLAGGGRNKEESFEESAYRELAEETGIHTVDKMMALGEPIYSHYYNNLKNRYKRSLGYGYLAVVSNSELKEAKREEHEVFEPKWMDMAEIRRGIEKLRSTKGGGVDHWLEICNRAEAAVEALNNGRSYEPEVYSGEGALFNSSNYDGMDSSEAREKIVADLAKKSVAKEKVNYKIRDWLISRQRYWGAPIPMIHCEKCGTQPVPEKDLPVVLPEVKSYEPSGDGRSPLANVPEFVNVKCPKCGGDAQRETDTMDGFACSSWYFLRFADPHNDKQPFSKEKAEFWLPVDDYIGGAEHAVMHLLYARMWTKVMYDDGLISFDEPFTTLRNQGMILAPDGAKMSKSKGNTIEPDGLIEQGYGADSIRLMELFIGPWNQAASWSVEGLAGMHRFLQRVWTLVYEYMDEASSLKPQAASLVESGNKEKEAVLMAAVHRAVKKVSEDTSDFSFNTALAAMMELTNELYKLKAEDGFASAPGWRSALETLLQLLAPFAPHMTEELWDALGHDTSIHLSPWPAWDEALIKEELITLAVQVNGKVRAELTVNADITEEEAVAAAKADAKITPHIKGKDVKKEIYVPGRLVSLVVK